MKVCENGICRDMTEEEVVTYNVELPPELRIEQLKQNLAETDYNILKIIEGETTITKCAEVITKRKAWRKEINELEELLTKQSSFYVKGGEKYVQLPIK